MEDVKISPGVSQKHSSGVTRMKQSTRDYGFKTLLQSGKSSGFNSSSSVNSRSSARSSNNWRDGKGAVSKPRRDGSRRSYSKDDKDLVKEQSSQEGVLSAMLSVGKQSELDTGKSMSEDGGEDVTAIEDISAFSAEFMDEMMKQRVSKADLDSFDAWYTAGAERKDAELLPSAPKGLTEINIASSAENISLSLQSAGSMDSVDQAMEEQGLPGSTEMIAAKLSETGSQGRESSAGSGQEIRGLEEADGDAELKMMEVAANAAYSEKIENSDEKAEEGTALEASEEGKMSDASLKDRQSLRNNGDKTLSEEEGIESSPETNVMGLNTNALNKVPDNFVVEEQNFTSGIEHAMTLPTSEANLPEDLSGLLSSRMNGQNGEIVIQLEPRELGQITIKLNYEGDHASLSILASNTKTMDLLSAHANEMGRILEQNTGNRTDVYVPRQEARQEDQNLMQNQGQSESKQQADRRWADENERRRHRNRSDSFVQQMRLGLV